MCPAAPRSSSTLYIHKQKYYECVHCANHTQSVHCEYVIKVACMHGLTVLGALCVDPAGGLGAGVGHAAGVRVPLVPRRTGTYLKQRVL